MWNTDDSPRRRANALVSTALIAGTVAGTAIAYYFGVALPTYDRNRLALEQRKYADEQRRRESGAKDAARKEETRTTSLQVCLDDAEHKRITFLKLNGTTKDGNIRRVFCR